MAELRWGEWRNCQRGKGGNLCHVGNSSFEHEEVTNTFTTYYLPAGLQ
jgi:hypothetical protein